MNGGADRDRVIRVIEASLPGSVATLEETRVATALLDGLEAAGYAVVRPGHVARVDELDDVADRLARLARLSSDTKLLADLGNAAPRIAHLRSAAEILLGLDLDDVDELDGDS